jgi:hypothetical protein
MTQEQLIEEGYSVWSSFRGASAKQSANEDAARVRKQGYKARVKRDGDVYRVWFASKCGVALVTFA